MEVHLKSNNTRTMEEDHTNHHRIHACQLCLKEFSSAKALGGHMRVHAHDKKTEHLPFESNRQNIYFLICSLCDKGFPSIKALSGHMRCHPERDWRGIHPPPTTTSDDDLVHLTTGWPVTGRRGRTTSSPSEEEEEEEEERGDDNDEEEFRIAASELLWLAQEKSINWNSGGDESEYSASAAEGTRGGVPKTTWSDQELDSRVTKMEYSKSDDDAKTRVNKRQDLIIYEAGDLYMEAESEKHRVRKRQKTRSTSELSSLDSAEKYKCSTCDKCFPSHQALGGHRSSHNKFKMVTINSMDAAAAADHDRDDHGPNPSSAVPHQCKICDRVFSTGQALGGHQRCHYSTGSAAAQTPKKTLLDFDLNEFPKEYDECGHPHQF